MMKAPILVISGHVTFTLGEPSLPGFPLTQAYVPFTLKAGVFGLGFGV